MIFINDDPYFKKHICEDPDTEFFYKGIFDRNLNDIISTLEKGKFPYGLKGNFAFFYKNKERVVFAVDHLPTINLFWSDNVVSHIFNRVPDKNSEPDNVIRNQMRIFPGLSLGTRTTIKNVNRLEAGTYYEKNLVNGKEKVSSYIDLLTQDVDNSITIEDISNIIETVIDEQTKNPFCLLWSSGTDSNSIYGFIRKLKRTENCELISLYSDLSSSDEREQIRHLEKTYGVSTTYINLGRYVGITDEVSSRYEDPNTPEDYKINYRRIWRGFWWDANLFQKYTSVYDLGVIDKKILTGEAGDYIFGSRYGKTILNILAQRPSTTAREIAGVFACLDAFSHRKQFFTPTEHWKKFINSSSDMKEAWDLGLDWIENKWNSINTGGDNINKVELLLNQFRASSRCYGYTQLQGTDFSHPFADYRLFHKIYKTPGGWKISQGKTRRLSHYVIKDFVDPGPWTWNKSGLEIPVYQRSIREKK
jgi:asparagine synthetase B (glutamine-hydrolysing)